MFVGVKSQKNFQIYLKTIYFYYTLEIIKMSDENIFFTLEEDSEEIDPYNHIVPCFCQGDTICVFYKYILYHSITTDIFLCFLNLTMTISNHTR